MANVVNQINVGGGQLTIYRLVNQAATPDTMEYEFTGYPHRSAAFVLDLTAFTTTASLTFKVEGVDRTSGKVYTLLAGAAVTSTSTNVYRVGPALTAAGNLVANDVLPPVFRITVTHGNANNHTYTLGALLA